MYLLSRFGQINISKAKARFNYVDTMAYCPFPNKPQYLDGTSILNKTQWNNLKNIDILSLIDHLSFYRKVVEVMFYCNKIALYAHEKIALQRFTGCSLCQSFAHTVKMSENCAGPKYIKQKIRKMSGILVKKWQDFFLWNCRLIWYFSFWKSWITRPGNETYLTS